MAGVARMTVEKLLRDLGYVCAMYQGVALRNLPCRRIQVDEIWSFVYAKAKNVKKKIRQEQGPNVGDIWTWTAIDAETKLVPSWLVGGRDAGYATEFLQDLAGRLANRVQLTSDGHKVYLTAVEDAFGADIDYAMLVKHYGKHARRREAIQPSRLHGRDTEDYHRQPRRSTHLHELRRASESHDAHEHAPVHAADERILEEDRESKARGRSTLHVLQLCADPQLAARDPGDGGWRHRQAVEHRGHDWAPRLKLDHYFVNLTVPFAVFFAFSAALASRTPRLLRRFGLSFPHP